MDAKKLDSPTVEERLAKLEGRCSALARQNRRLKVAGIVAVVLVPALVLSCGAKGPTTAEDERSDDADEVAEVIKARSVQVQELIVVDEDGTRHAELLVAEEGPELVLFDEKGKTRAKLSVPEEGPRLSLNDENGNSRVELYAIADLMTLSIRDEGLVPRAMLSFLDQPILTLNDEHGKTGLSLTMGEDGPVLLLFGKDDKPRVGLMIQDEPGFVLFGRDYKTRASLSLDKDGSPSLKFYDKEEKVIWQAPPPDDAPEEAEAGEE